MVHKYSITPKELIMYVLNHTAQQTARCAGWCVVVFSPELLDSGKINVSLRLYCSVRLATLYRLPLVEKLSPSAWPSPNSATSHGELLPVPHELLNLSTVVELGRETCTVFWWKTSDMAGVHKEIQHTDKMKGIWHCLLKCINIKAFRIGNQNIVVTVHTVLLVVLYLMENDAESSALMQVELPSFTSRVTAWMQPVWENIMSREAQHYNDMEKHSKKSTS